MTIAILMALLVGGTWGATEWLAAQRPLVAAKWHPWLVGGVVAGSAVVLGVVLATVS